MSFRTRLILVGAVAVSIAVTAASAVTFAVVRDQLLGSVDDSLRERAGSMFRLRVFNDPATGKPVLDSGPPGFPGSAPYVQIVPVGGAVIREHDSQSVPLPVTDRTRALARDGGSPFFSDATIDGVHVRILTTRVSGRGGETYALQIARTLDEVDSSLARIRRWLIFVAVGGVALAVGLGLLVARAALAPVRRLTRAAEDVTETRDLSRRIEVTGRDELSRMASTFNEMLSALEESARAQRQLVADASHELRTPLTSLRTNIEVLARERELPPGERESLLRDVTDQLQEMTALVAELVELARGDVDVAEQSDVRLDLVTADAIERTRRNRPGVTIEADLSETVVHGVAGSLERAVSNLLDNAAKWSPPGGRVEVAVVAGEVTVRDHGPGIDAEDMPHVFDRFYRAEAARGLPGSGLGLSIVRQVAEAHGGSVSAEPAGGGGALLRLRLAGHGSGLGS